MGAIPDGKLRVRVAEVLEKGKANAECFAFLAKHCGVSLRHVEFISGQTASIKLMCVGK